jgi:hypothetical protein
MLDDEVDVRKLLFEALAPAVEECLKDTKPEGADEDEYRAWLYRGLARHCLFAGHPKEAEQYQAMMSARGLAQ